MKRSPLALLFGIAATLILANPLKVIAHPKNFNLTPEQETQWEEIRTETKAKIQNILTPEQQQQFQNLTSENQGKGIERAIWQLNLSEEQKTQVRQIMESSHEQIEGFLTEEQREQFRQRGHGHARLENLNLTPEQKTQWEEIKAQTKAEIENILTAEQQEKFQTLTAQGQRGRKLMQQLNLSEDQKTQMREIMQSSHQQMANILTEEQKEQLRKHRGMRRGNR
ncbi:hypothetical protein [Okeania sp.]|uniref:hypothetical protein n=1 Tax=Okeania sp. TaxID=3100323 RepID=UPI002B4AF5F7|nr:hypothetical protein [Okeania sp.]MEB3342420.1 hypothetical protein [Okeania sp.]